ncbi:cytochrome c oxidase subunit II [Candidatus Woesearchaeota archaeon]|nr:MAG: cytochrome c oxidase subunit II [Candidatus Woesearchaeota archaeon]
MILMKSYALFAVLALVLLLSGCQAQSPAQENSGAPQQENKIDSYNPPSRGPEGVEEKEIELTARNWEFIPNTITVKEGDYVSLKITSEDVTHGFSLPAFGINEQLEPGKTVEVEFVADKKGTFPFACSVYCGRGHGSMTGKLVVE